MALINPHSTAWITPMTHNVSEQTQPQTQSMARCESPECHTTINEDLHKYLSTQSSIVSPSLSLIVDNHNHNHNENVCDQDMMDTIMEHMDDDDCDDYMSDERSSPLETLQLTHRVIDLRQDQHIIDLTDESHCDNDDDDEEEEEEKDDDYGNMEEHIEAICDEVVPVLYDDIDVLIYQTGGKALEMLLLPKAQTSWFEVADDSDESVFDHEVMDATLMDEGFGIDEDV